MAKPNYQYEKRQKELAKKAKKLEKQQRKAGHPEGEDAAPDATHDAESPESATADAVTTDTDATP